MKKTAILVSLVLIAAACSSGTDDTADRTTAVTSAPATTEVTSASATTEVTSASATTAVTSAAATTAVTSAAATTAGTSAAFAIQSVTFGASGLVIITNTGTEPAELSGHWLCQRPSYAQIPDVTLAPGELVAIPLGEGAAEPPAGATAVEPIIGVGGLEAGSGELALYSAAEFDDSTAIVSYVEWGNSGHGRSSVAVAAGIWPEGDFVPTTEGTIGIVAETVPAQTPDAWFTEG